VDASATILFSVDLNLSTGTALNSTLSIRYVRPPCRRTPVAQTTSIHWPPLRRASGNHDPSGPADGFHPSSQPGQGPWTWPSEILHIIFFDYAYRCNLYISIEKIDEINKRVNGDFHEETAVCIGLLHEEGKSRTVLRIEISCHKPQALLAAYGTVSVVSLPAPEYVHIMHNGRPCMLRGRPYVVTPSVPSRAIRVPARLVVRPF